MFTIILLVFLSIFVVVSLLTWKEGYMLFFDFDSSEHLAIAIVAGACAFIITFCSGTFSVDEGEAVILTKFGKAYDVVAEPDLHLKRPWASIESWDTRLKAAHSDLTVDTRDGHEVTIYYTVWWKIDIQNLRMLYATVSEDFYNLQTKFVLPEISSAIRSVVAEVDYSELKINRRKCALMIKEEVGAKLKGIYILVDRASILDVVRHTKVKEEKEK